MRFDVLIDKKPSEIFTYQAMKEKPGLYKNSDSPDDKPCLISMGGQVFYLWTTDNILTPASESWQMHTFKLVATEFTVINTKDGARVTDWDLVGAELVDHTTLPYNTVVKFGKSICVVAYNFSVKEQKNLVSLDDTSQTWTGDRFMVQVLGTLKRAD